MNKNKKFFYKCTVNEIYYISANPISIKNICSKDKNIFIIEKVRNNFIDMKNGKSYLDKNIMGDKDTAIEYYNLIKNKKHAELVDNKYIKENPKNSLPNSIHDSWTSNYSYTGSWADDAELLEEDDFYRPSRRQWWIDNLNELKKQTTKLSRQRQAIRMISSINDFKNKDIWKEMNRFLRVIINEYDSYFAHTHDSVRRYNEIIYNSDDEMYEYTYKYMTGHFDYDEEDKVAKYYKLGLMINELGKYLYEITVTGNKLDIEKYISDLGIDMK